MLAVSTVQSTERGPGSVTMPGERRAFRRASLDRPVLVETESSSFTARSVDVSGGGIALQTERPLAVGDRLSVYFELPIGYGVETQAEVLRREGDRVALRFIAAPPEAVLAVRSFCRVSGLVPGVRPNGRLVGG